MAKTQIADVIEPAIFHPYVILESNKLSKLFGAGLISQDPKIAESAKAGGRTVNMPFWQALSGADEVLSDSAALTPGKVTADQDVAVLHLRGKAWAANDLAEVAAGSDPMKAIATMAGAYWAERMQVLLVAMLKGIFGAGGALADTHVQDIAIEAGNSATADNLFSADAMINALFKLGDREADLQAIMVHSKVYQRMRVLDLIEFVPDSKGAASIPTYQGRRVIVDDETLKVAGATNGFKYYSFLFGPGAIGYGEGTPPVPVETDRDSLAGDDILIHRRRFILHPRGVKWTGSPAGAAPTNTELETVGNWAQAYPDRDIKIIALVTNG